jgi:hypothetical protein
MVSLLVIVLFVVFSFSALGAEKLSGVIAYNLKSIGPRLDKAENLLDQGDKPNAQASYDTAKQYWDALHKDFKGQFDIKHPEIVALQKRFDVIEARLSGVEAKPAPTPAPTPQDPAGKAPPAAMAYSMKQIQANLNKAEKLLGQGDVPNAASNHSSARMQWKALMKDNAGKFDPNHSDVVALRKRFDALGTQLNAAGEAKPAPTPAPTALGAVGKAPPAAMLYVMKQIDSSLNAAEKAHTKLDLGAAQDFFSDAEKYWLAQQKDYRGQYDPAHPSVVAMNEKYLRVKAKVESLEGQANQAAENLPVVLAAISDIQKKIDAADQKARESARNVSSLMSDYDSGREQNVDKLRLKVDELRERSELVNALLPDAHAAAATFRAQYPDFNQLQKLLRDGREAALAVERIEKFPAYWLEEGKRLINEALSMAEGNIKQFSVERFQSLAGMDKAIQTNVADSADFSVMELSTFLLDIVPSILPELPQGAQTLLPQFAQARQNYQKRTVPMRAEIQKIGVEIGKIRKEVVDAEKRKLDRARFPKTQFTGGQWSAAEKVIGVAWAEAIKDKQLLKLSIYLPWEERSEARWRNDRWVIGTYRYISANCLAKLSTGKYRVYRMTFRNTKQANGSWSPLKHWSVGHSYEILEGNINK